MNNTDKRYTTVQSVGKSCVGCRSCEQKCPKNCISIMPDKEGFLYPVIDNDKCIGCKVCVNSCPAVNMPQKRQPISVYALKNKDKKRILSSASGGASDVFAGYVIDNGGVVYGCAYDADMLVKHIELTDKESLKRIQSSKYVQSDWQLLF
jgi:NAD-dependent dihydropyrimidine dehydrogenase PreA subunit